MSEQSRATPMSGQPSAPALDLKQSVAKLEESQKETGLQLEKSQDTLPAKLMEYDPKDPETRLYTDQLNKNLRKKIDTETEQMKADFGDYSDPDESEYDYKRVPDDPIVVLCFCNPCQQFNNRFIKYWQNERLKFAEEVRVWETKKKKLEDEKNEMEAEEKQLLEDWKEEEQMHRTLQNVNGVYTRRIEVYDQANNNPDVPPIVGCPTSQGRGMI